MKKMKHGGKARKSHKRMQDGGIASYGSASNLKPGMQALASSDAYMRRPGRGNEGMYRPIGRPGRGGATGYQAGGGMTSDADSAPMNRGGAMGRPGRGGSFSDIQGIIGGAMGLPIRGGAMTSDVNSVPMNRGGAMGRPGRGNEGMYRPIGRPGRGGAMVIQTGGGMTSDANSTPMGRGGSIGGATGYQAGGGMTSDADSVPMGRGFRKGGAVKGKKMAAGGIAHSPGKPSTISNRPAGSGNSGGMYRPVGRPPSAAGRPSTVKPSSPGRLRGGGLARKGVGMALAKGGLAKRAGGCAKRGVGRGKMV